MMMKEVFLVSDNIISPLGVNTAENFLMLKNGASGVKEQQLPEVSSVPFYASLFSDETALLKDENNTYTKFELLLIASIQDALKNSAVSPSDKKTILIISSTKGNISLLENAPMNDALKKRIALHTSAKLVGEYFKCSNMPVVISNACISGSLALITAKRLIQSGQYDHAIVAGADTISKFILSGFQSFQAISNALCKPFDANRTGINLGEGAATIILSENAAFSNGIKITGGATSNDANHISGPSRTGEELCIAITKAMQEAKVSSSAIDYISAHGTATIYNDEMEAQAITLAGLQSVSTNSLKGYYGHTLGAAGLIESVVAVHSLKENMVLPSIGFETMGVSTPINISAGLQNQTLNNCLKTASGFGGCNAAIIFGKA
ncbi:MAG: beta-ketoacyl synthase N-terminal-like domain-containing protein [Ferruginibacter sp.]